MSRARIFSWNLLLLSALMLSGCGSYTPDYSPKVDRTTASHTILFAPGDFYLELMPTPNRFTPLNIPVLPGAVIEGTVRRITDTDTVAVAGADVILRHLASGRSRRIRTFSDGSFYVMSIRPGEWTAEVDPEVLARLGRRSGPVGFTVGADEAGTSISGLELRIR